MGSLPIEDLGQAIETAKRILTKEKIDRQLTGQSTSTAVLSIQVGYSSNKSSMSFNTQDMLDNKIDKLTSMMNTLSTQHSNQNDHLSKRFIKEERKDKVEIIIMIEIGYGIGLDQVVVI